MESHSTVLQTEIAAILQCACKAQDYGCSRNVRICSDSRVAITTLHESVTISMLVCEYFKALNKLASYNQVSVLWIPEHKGIKDNEIAAGLAKLTTRQNRTGLEPVIGTSNRSVTEDISKWLAEEHQKEWYKATVASQNPHGGASKHQTSCRHAWAQQNRDEDSNRSVYWRRQPHVSQA